MFDTSLPCDGVDSVTDELRWSIGVDYPDGGLVLSVLDDYGWREAYKISNFVYDGTEFSIDVYCYANGQTYTLTCVENYDWTDFEW